MDTQKGPAKKLKEVSSPSYGLSSPCIQVKEDKQIDRYTNT